MGSSLVRTPPQSVLVRERGQDINQPAAQTTQPGSEPAQIGVTENALQEDPIVSTLRMTNVRGMIDVGTNTSDVEVRPHRDSVRTSTMDANAQTSRPIVDVMLPSGRGDHLAIPQVNLSISGYEPDSLRNSHIRSPSMRAQEISIVPQLDGLASLPMRRSYWKDNKGRPQVSGMRIFTRRHIYARSLHTKKEGISRRKWQ